MRKFYQLINETVDAAKISGANLFLEELNNDLSKDCAILEGGHINNIINAIFEDSEEEDMKYQQSLEENDGISDELIDKVLRAIDED